MPSTFTPFGLKAKHSPSGVIRPQRWVVPASDVVNNAASWSKMFQDEAVYLDSNGRLQVTNDVNSTTRQCVGSFSGVEFNDSNGRRTVSNQFNPSLINNPVANQGLGTTDVWFWLYTDPELVFEVQAASNVVQIATSAASTSSTTLTFTSTTGVVVGDVVTIAGNVLPVGTVVTATTSTTVTISNAVTIASGTNVVFVHNTSGFTIAQIGNLLSYSQNNGQNTVTGFGNGFAFQNAQTAGGGSFVVYNLAYDNQPSNAYVAGSPVAINGNSWGDVYPNVLVRLANPQFNGTLPGF